MTLLVDTHAALWWLAGDPRLSAAARQALADSNNRVFWSVASSFEVAIKVSVGTLSLGRSPAALFAALLTDEGFELLTIENAHCHELSSLPLHHRDPFDRMLVAQARVEAIPLLSADAKMSAYDVPLLW